MLKKLAFIAALLTILALPNNSARANTYMNAVSKAVDHIVDTHKDTADIEKNVVSEPETKPTIPVKETRVEVKKKLWVTATAYSSTRWQTDDTPCITSTGYDVCNKTKNIIAVSRDLVRSLGYHRQVRLPSLYGSEIFYIEDTMNARFVNRIDIHHDSIKDAREFGVKRIEIEVI